MYSIPSENLSHVDSAIILSAFNKIKYLIGSVHTNVPIDRYNVRTRSLCEVGHIKYISMVGGELVWRINLLPLLFLLS